MADDNPVLTPLRDMFKMCHQIFYIVNGIFACALLRMVFVWSFVAQHRFGGFLLDKHFYLKSIFTCLSMMQCEVAVLRIYAYFNECSQLYSFAFIAERDMFYTIQSFFFFLILHSLLFSDIETCFIQKDCDDKFIFYFLEF